MARVMICDDDQELATQLVAALVAAGHEAETCRHTMDMLREAAGGHFDLIALGLDMAGFGRAGAVEALTEIAPHVPVIALHERPGEIMHAATQGARFAAVLPRAAAAHQFLYAVACALNETKPHQMNRPEAPAARTRRRAIS
jgi:DNA-binding NtrC family response regulator